jgi:hypothetical protein
LATLPCADAAITETEQIVLADNHDHEGETDNCAPLCYCHCCHVHVTISTPNAPLKCCATIFSQVVFYQFFTPETPSVSLFRPPIV